MQCTPNLNVEYYLDLCHVKQLLIINGLMLCSTVAHLCRSNYQLHHPAGEVTVQVMQAHVHHAST